MQFGQLDSDLSSTPALENCSIMEATSNAAPPSITKAARPMIRATPSWSIVLTIAILVGIS